MSTRTGVYQGRKAAFFVSNQSWQRSVVVSKRRTARVTVDRRSREGTERERLGDEEARCKMQTGAGGQREEGERGGRRVRHGLKISHFGPVWNSGDLGGPSFPVHPPVNPRATPGGAGARGHRRLARPGPCDLPALQGAFLVALSRTGTSATRCWTLVGWPLV